jgi:hypothetical protein
MNEEIIRLKKLAGILTESIQAVPGIGKKNVPEETESEMQTQTTAAVNQGDAESAEAMANTVATEEEEHLYEAKKMTAKNKAKEKKLKKKYDKSGMKSSMIKQYGKEKGKQVYFAKIRGEAMKEGIEVADPFDQHIEVDDDQGMLVASLRDVLETLQELATAANQQSMLLFAKDELDNIIADCSLNSQASPTIQNVCQALEEVVSDIDSGRANNIESVASVISDCVRALADESGLEESIFNNGYDEQYHAEGSDYFPDGADSPVVDQTGAAGARQGDNPEQKSMKIVQESASIHRDLVYSYRNFLKEHQKN